MDGTIFQYVASLGFPIVACFGLAWFVKYQTDSNNKEVADMRREHKEEVQKMTEALNNNTIALQKLTDRLENAIK